MTNWLLWLGILQYGMSQVGTFDTDATFFQSLMCGTTLLSVVFTWPFADEFKPVKRFLDAANSVYQETYPGLVEELVRDALNQSALEAFILPLLLYGANLLEFSRCVNGFNLNYGIVLGVMALPCIYFELDRCLRTCRRQPPVNLRIPRFNGVNRMTLYYLFRNSINDHNINCREFSQVPTLHERTFFNFFCDYDRQVLRENARRSLHDDVSIQIAQ